MQTIHYGLDILEDFVQVFSKTCRTKPTVWTFVTDLPGAVIFLSFQCYSEQTKGIQELSKITFPSFNFKISSLLPECDKTS